MPRRRSIHDSESGGGELEEAPQAAYEPPVTRARARRASASQSQPEVLQQQPSSDGNDNEDDGEEDYAATEEDGSEDVDDEDLEEDAVVDDDDDEEEEESGAGAGLGRQVIGWLLGRANAVTSQRTARLHRQGPQFRPLAEVPVEPLQGPLALELNTITSGANKRRRCDAPGLDRGVDPATGEVGPPPLPPWTSAAPPTPPHHLHQDPHTRSGAATAGDGATAGGGTAAVAAGAEGGRGRGSRRSSGSGEGASPPPAAGGSGSGRSGSSGRRQQQRRGAAKKTQAAAPAGPSAHDPAKQEGACASASAADDADASGSGWRLLNRCRQLLKRDCALGTRPGFSRSERAHMMCSPSAVPHVPQQMVDHMDSRAYIGQFSEDGRFFVAAYQDRRVRVYDTHHGWKLRKDVRARLCRWTITDTCMSPDQRLLLYSSITPTVHLVNLGSNWGQVESVANVSEVHEALHFDESGDRFGIWSIGWSGDGREVVAGANDDSVYVFDVESSRVVARIRAHDDDVNAVEYGDGSPNLIISGSDDCLIKVWDRRMQDASGRRAAAAGVLVGHTEGLTHLDTRGDARYLISNCKDQSVKLWDLRAMLTPRQVAALPAAHVPRFNWDYRWMAYPGAGYDVRHPHDKSLKTYRGHSVGQTLIRAYFSPEHSTGQRFIYSGSNDGSVVVYDVVTGLIVQRLRYHHALVRDCSWHPHLPLLTSVSWDGSVITWGPGPVAADDPAAGKSIRLPTPAEDQGYY